MWKCDHRDIGVLSKSNFVTLQFDRKIFDKFRKWPIFHTKLGCFYCNCAYLTWKTDMYCQFGEINTEWLCPQVHILTRRHFSYKTECHSTVTCSMITYKYWTDSICTLMHFVSYSKIKKGKKNTFYHRKSIFSCSESELVISIRTVGRYIKITIHIRFECSCELSIQNKA